jgi:hypothetical protein
MSQLEERSNLSKHSVNMVDFVDLEQVYNSTLNSDPGEPKSFKEALQGNEKEQWTQSIKNEINNFLKRNAWEKVSREKVTMQMKRKLIKTKWIFKKKLLQDGSIKFKSRVVSKGFMQIPGVDFTESFSPVATDTTIRLMIGIYLFYRELVPEDDWVLESFDVEAAFLNSEVERETFIEWPEGMIELGFITEQEKKDYCIQLKKAMYGNIDAPLCWMRTFSKYLIETVGLMQSKVDPCVFIKRDKDEKLVLLLAIYVDDTIITGANREVMRAYKLIQLKFIIDILGTLLKHLGIIWKWIKNEKGEICLQATMPLMLEDILKSYEQATGKQATIAPTPGYPGLVLSKYTRTPIKLGEYRSLVGKLIYYMTKIAPDISNAVRELSTHLASQEKNIGNRWIDVLDILQRIRIKD